MTAYDVLSVESKERWNSLSESDASKAPCVELLIIVEGLGGVVQCWCSLCY